jgi:hypothetical protein
MRKTDERRFFVVGALCLLMAVVLCLIIAKRWDFDSRCEAAAGQIVCKPSSGKGRECFCVGARGEKLP